MALLAHRLPRPGRAVLGRRPGAGSACSWSAGTLALSALSLIPRSQRWFTPLGSASLVVYLFHGFVVKGAEYAGVGGLSEHDPVTAFLAVTAAAVG